MTLRRLVPTVAALAVLALNVYVLFFAVYVAGADELSGALGPLTAGLAGAAVVVGIAAVVSATRGPVPERSLLLSLFAAALDAVWYVFVFLIVVR
jgi:hypothetical protein